MTQRVPVNLRWRTTMKTFLLAVVATAMMLGAGVAAAATQQWTYERPMGQVYQILCDGSGGCAIMAMDTNGLIRIAWLDSKGVVLYEAVLPSGTSSLGVMSCDKSGMVYSVTTVSSAYLVCVNKKGTASPAE